MSVHRRSTAAMIISSQLLGAVGLPESVQALVVSLVSRRGVILDTLIAEPMVTWPLLRALFFAGLGAASASAQNGTAPIVIDYPADGSVFPPDMAAPTFLWRDPSPGAVSWRIDVSFADGSAAIHVTAKGEPMQIGEIDPRCVSSTNRPPSLTPQQAAAHTWIPVPADWAAIKKRSLAGPATIAISGFAAGNALQP